MESNINHQVIKSYSQSFTEDQLNKFFNERSAITGEEILHFSKIKQINYFILKILFEKWKMDFNQLKSPYFNFEHEEVKKAAQSFMNELSNYILIDRHDFGALVEEATYKTLLLIFSPYEFYLQELNNPASHQVTINDLTGMVKYIKINDHLLQAYIKRFKADGIMAVFNDDAVRIFDEVCESIKETPEDFEQYHQEFSEIVALDLNEVYSQPDKYVSEKTENSIQDEIDSLHNKFKTEQQTLLDTLDTDKKEAIIDIHEKKPLEGIRKNITINQRFMFENDLFNGDKDEFEMVVNYLDNCQSNREAMEFINENYVDKKNWDLKREEVVEFFSVIKKRFPE